MRSGPPHSQINILMPFPFSMCTLVRRTMRRLCLCECPCVCYLPGTLHASRHQQEAAASVFRNSKDQCAGDLVTTQKQASALICDFYSTQFYFLFQNRISSSRDEKTAKHVLPLEELSTYKQPASFSSFKKPSRKRVLINMPLVFPSIAMKISALECRKQDKCSAIASNGKHTIRRNECVASIFL